MSYTIESHTEAFKERHKAALSAAMPKAAEVHLEFLRERFAREGDGEWPELAPRTQAEREEQGFSPAHPILRRSEVLYGALFPGNPGNVFVVDGSQVTIGISGGGHPGYGGGNQATIEHIARTHQLGIGIPVRRIFVEPDESTKERMTAIIKDHLMAEVIE